MTSERPTVLALDELTLKISKDVERPLTKTERRKFRKCQGKLMTFGTIGFEAYKAWILNGEAPANYELDLVSPVAS